MLSRKTQESILELQKAYPEKRSALLPALHLAQAEVGYLPRELQNEIAALFDIEPNEVNAIVTFYDMFFEEPVGKHLLHVCKNVSCMLNGSDDLLDRLCHQLDIKPGKTTADGEFTVIASECLAACDRAPVVMVDDRIVGHVKEKDVERLLEEAKKGPGHNSPADELGDEHA